MKIILSASGELIIDSDGSSAQEIASFVREIQQQAKQEEKKSIAPAEINTGSLNVIQYQGWEFLCENDNEHGVTIDAYARHAKINDSTASQRFGVLVKMGYAIRVARGRYRPAIP